MALSSHPWRRFEDRSGSIAAIDALVDPHGGLPTTLLELVRLKYEIEGSGTHVATLSGPLDAIRADGIALCVSEA